MVSRGAGVSRAGFASDCEIDSGTGSDIDGKADSAIDREIDREIDNWASGLNKCPAVNNPP